MRKFRVSFFKKSTKHENKRIWQRKTRKIPKVSNGRWRTIKLTITMWVQYTLTACLKFVRMQESLIISLVCVTDLLRNSEVLAHQK